MFFSPKLFPLNLHPGNYHSCDSYINRVNLYEEVFVQTLSKGSKAINYHHYLERALSTARDMTCSRRKVWCRRKERESWSGEVGYIPTCTALRQRTVQTHCGSEILTWTCRLVVRKLGENWGGSIKLKATEYGSSQSAVPPLFYHLVTTWSN